MHRQLGPNLDPQFAYSLSDRQAAPAACIRVRAVTSILAAFPGIVGPASENGAEARQLASAQDPVSSAQRVGGTRLPMSGRRPRHPRAFASQDNERPGPQNATRSFISSDGVLKRMSAEWRSTGTTDSRTELAYALSRQRNTGSWQKADVDGRSPNSPT